MLACLGCSGCLLQEDTLDPSEFGGSYVRDIPGIIVLRKENVCLPHRVIIDNPSVLESEVHSLVAAVWGDRKRAYVLSGGPVRRKIEFDASLDSTHQDTEGDMRDFAYLVRRFGSLTPRPPASTLDAEPKKLRSEIDDMRGYLRIQHGPIQFAAPR